MPPPPKKKYKAATPQITDELAAFQSKIQMIKSQPTDIIEEVDEANNEHDYETRIVDFSLSDVNRSSDSRQEEDDIRKYIREQIRFSERRILQRCERIEQKINRLLELQTAQPAQTTDQLIEEEHLLNVEYVENDMDTRSEVDELDSSLFPITDEATFDWFFDKLATDPYRNALIERRWPLTRNVSTKSFNISVKEFLRMHFDLNVVVKYSVSGFGSHGIRKKKLDSNSLCIYVYECFSRSSPGFNSFQDVNRAVVQFWGRAPDVLNKQNERAVRRSFKVDEIGD